MSNCDHKASLHHVRLYWLTHRVEVQCCSCRAWFVPERFSLTLLAPPLNYQRITYSDTDWNTCDVEIVYEPIPPDNQRQ